MSRFNSGKLVLGPPIVSSFNTSTINSSLMSLSDTRYRNIDFVTFSSPHIVSGIDNEIPTRSHISDSIHPIRNKTDQWFSSYSPNFRISIYPCTSTETTSTRLVQIPFSTSLLSSNQHLGPAISPAISNVSTESHRYSNSSDDHITANLTTHYSTTSFLYFTTASQSINSVTTNCSDIASGYSSDPHSNSFVPPSDLLTTDLRTDIATISSATSYSSILQPILISPYVSSSRKFANNSRESLMLPSSLNRIGEEENKTISYRLETITETKELIFTQITSWDPTTENIFLSKVNFSQVIPHTNRIVYNDGTVQLPRLCLLVLALLLAIVSI